MFVLINFVHFKIDIVNLTVTVISVTPVITYILVLRKKKYIENTSLLHYFLLLL